MLRLQTESEHPSARHIARITEILRGGGLVVYPTDTAYGLGCDLYAKRSIDRIYQLKGLDASHRLSFLCSDLSQVAQYAVVTDHNYRILRHHTPGPYTFSLPATREVPRVMQSKARTVGVRIPANKICLGMIEELGHPIITTTVSRRVDGESTYMNDPDEIAAAFRRSIECLVDVGPLYEEPSSMIDLTGERPVIIRKGSGDLSWLGEEN